MWRWKPREKIGEQRVTDGRRLGTDGEKQRGTRRDQGELQGPGGTAIGGGCQISVCEDGP